MNILQKIKKIKRILRSAGYLVTDDEEIIDKNNRDNFDFGKFTDLLPILKILERNFSVEITNNILHEMRTWRSDLGNLAFIVQVAEENKCILSTE